MGGFDFMAAINRAEWSGWLHAWQAIGTCEAVRHNLLVLTLAEDVDVRKAAAREVSFVIGAVLARAT